MANTTPQTFAKSNDEFIFKKHGEYCLNKTNVYFVFPVFNESLNIPRVLQDLPRLEEIVSSVSSHTQFLFIDDGSTDDTVTQLRAAQYPGLTILSHAQNQG